MDLANISWEECQEYLARDNRVILPIGATEAHGRHLGLGCDYLLAEALARETGLRSGVLVAPVLAYGMSHMLTRFPGTVSLNPGTLALVLQDLLRSFYQSGFRRVLVVNGHGGNDPSLRSAAAVVGTELPDLRIKNVAWWLEPVVTQLVEAAAGPQRGSHASTHETAFLMAVRPDAVKPERMARRDAPVEPSHELIDPEAFARAYPDAVMGLEPRRANSAMGKSIFKAALEVCVREIENW